MSALSCIPVAYAFMCQDFYMNRPFYFVFSLLFALLSLHLFLSLSSLPLHSISSHSLLSLPLVPPFSLSLLFLPPVLSYPPFPPFLPFPSSLCSFFPSLSTSSPSTLLLLFFLPLLPSPFLFRRRIFLQTVCRCYCRCQRR